MDDVKQTGKLIEADWFMGNVKDYEYLVAILNCKLNAKSPKGF